MFCKLLCITAQEREGACEDKGLGFFLLYLLIAKAMFDRESLIQIGLTKSSYGTFPNCTSIVLSSFLLLQLFPSDSDILLHFSIERMHNPCYTYQLTLDAFSCSFGLFKTKNISERNCLFFFPWKLINLH